jgi:murein DD-endopeptidase MepM/ murein hydrolase activator NlpD
MYKKQLFTLFLLCLALMAATLSGQAHADGPEQTEEIVVFEPQDESGTNQRALTAVTRRLQGFPWRRGETWKYSQDLHGSANNGLDFGTPDGRVGKIYAADSGQLLSVDSCTLIIKRSDGLRHGYHHVVIDPALKMQFDRYKRGERGPVNVSFQTYLGTTALCGGSNGHHVHFWLYDEATKSDQKAFNPIGFLFADWTLSKQRDTSEGTPNESLRDPKTGYDYPFQKASQIICAGQTWQNGRNICTGSKIYFQ